MNTLNINYIVSDTETDSAYRSGQNARRIVTENKALKRTWNLSSRTVKNAPSEADVDSIAPKQVLEMNIEDTGWN